MATHRQTSKNLEKRVAEYLNIERTSTKGLGTAIDDCAGSLVLKESIDVSVEVKLRAKLPAIINEALDQARRNAKTSIPMTVIKQKGAFIEDAIVSFRLSEFKRLIGKQQYELFEEEDNDISD